MRARMMAFLGMAVLGGLAATASQGQDRPLTPPVEPEKSPLQRQMDQSAQRGADWLRRANGPDGRFVPGYAPALRAVLDGDHYLHQVRAAHALAKAARGLRGERFAAVARQAILRLLLETGVEGKGRRATTLPSAVVNRLEAAGWLILTIHELPKPGEDLLDQSDELCRFIARQQRSNGSLCFTDTDDPKSIESPEGVRRHPGPALYALMFSQRHRSSPWKTEVVRKALPYYRAWWNEHKDPAFVPWQTAAYAAAYVETRDNALLEFVSAMNDWLCDLQYQRLDPRQPLWLGGFRGWADGKPLVSAPTAESAVYALSLAEARKALRVAGDVPRHQRYQEAQERCLQFLTTLQFTEANTQHFADWYRPALLGGFFASSQDGTLRLDFTAHAVTAMVAYVK